MRQPGKRPAAARALAALGALLLLPLAAAPAEDENADFFKQSCASCHTIGGGRLVGPDLQNVSQRKDREWIVRFILDPRGILDSGDPYALQLQKEARGAVMANIAGMTRQRAEALLALIEAESKLEKSRFKGLQISDRPFTAADMASGRKLFKGSAPLKAGGAPCISCHTVRGLGSLGGGRLGPDLTQVFERLGGRKPLATWLSAPATATMQASFKGHPLDPDEILGLTAYFQGLAMRGGQDSSPSRANFILFGLAGAVVALVAFDQLWSRRFRGVRRPLVSGRRRLQR